MRRPDRFPATALSLVVALLAPLALVVRAASEGEAPPDLRLEWLEPVPAKSSATTVGGRPGTTVVVSYRVRNVGGSDAFAVILEARTALGRLTPPRRLQPGPEAGASIDRSLRFALAEGMRELCLDALLQTLAIDDAGDPNLENNRICLEIDVDGGADRRTERRIR